MKQITALLILLIAATAIGEEPSLKKPLKSVAKSKSLTKTTPALRTVDYHTFTTTNGTITARPVDFSESRGEVKLKARSGKISKVQFGMLPEKEQAFIKDWHTAYALLDKKIRITTKDKTKAQSSRGRSRSTENLWYEFEIINKARDSVDNLTIEYCVYSQTEVEKTTQPGRIDAMSVSYDGPYGSPTVSGGFVATGPAKEHPDQLLSHETSGTFNINQLQRREVIERTTERTVFYDNYTRKGGGQNRTLKDSKLLGIRYRVYLPTPNGNWAMMEFAEPESLLKETEWPSATQTESK